MPDLDIIDNDYSLIRFTRRAVQGCFEFLNKTQLQDLTGLSPATMAKLGKGSSVTTDILSGIGEVLDWNIPDICEIVPVELAPENTPTTKEHAHVATH